MAHFIQCFAFVFIFRRACSVKQVNVWLDDNYLFRTWYFRDIIFWKFSRNGGYSKNMSLREGCGKFGRKTEKTSLEEGGLAAKKVIPISELFLISTFCTSIFPFLACDLCWWCTFMGQGVCESVYVCVCVYQI